MKFPVPKNFSEQYQHPDTHNLYPLNLFLHSPLSFNHNMLKMAILLLPPLFFLCISVAGQQLLQISSLHHQDSTPEALQPISHAMGVSVDHDKLNDVSTSVLMAEKWLRTHVLSRYPSTNITSIVVFNSRLCDESDEQMLKQVLFAMGNVHHALVRWGLEKKIKVSVCFTPKCLHQPYVQPVFELLEEINSTYTLKSDDFSGGSVEIMSSYVKSMADLGVFRLKTVNVMMTSGSKHPVRKLLSTVQSPEFDYSIPSDAATAPLPPLIGITPPLPPFLSPASSAQPPYGLHLPPCNPHHGGGGGGAMAAPPLAVAREGLWCVAKPSVPSEKLQEAMDYACGDGGAECGPIRPTGSCYSPDSIVAHASYAFNSYWQKKKNNGGTCGFAGTAMLISSDPSYLQCHFTLA